MWKWLLLALCFSSQVFAQDLTQKIEQGVPVEVGNPIESNSGFVNSSDESASDQFITPQKPLVYVKKIKSPLNTVYKKVFTSLDNNGYFVVFEPNIGKSLAHFAKRWGDDYNRNKLESIRSMVFCNGWYANKVSNADPTMLALCPLHITLIHKKGTTSILFVRPGRVAVNSPAEDVANELEQDVIRSIEEALVR
ncbi:MAG: DUF302 domain-containing protein [Gammaproteobacteria bacterium]